MRQHCIHLNGTSSSMELDCVTVRFIVSVSAEKLSTLWNQIISCFATNSLRASNEKLLFPLFLLLFVFASELGRCIPSSRTGEVRCSYGHVPTRRSASPLSRNHGDDCKYVGTWEVWKSWPVRKHCPSAYFTGREHSSAMQALYWLYDLDVCLSVCLSVCPSVGHTLALSENDEWNPFEFLDEFFYPEN